MTCNLWFHAFISINIILCFNKGLNLLTAIYIDVTSSHRFNFYCHGELYSRHTRLWCFSKQKKKKIKKEKGLGCILPYGRFQIRRRSRIFFKKAETKSWLGLIEFCNLNEVPELRHFTIRAWFRNTIMICTI